jgi:hypothetical protein
MAKSEESDISALLHMPKEPVTEVPGETPISPPWIMLVTPSESDGVEREQNLHTL